MFFREARYRGVMYGEGDTVAAEINVRKWRNDGGEMRRALRVIGLCRRESLDAAISKV